MGLRLAIIVQYPLPNHAPWYREIAKIKEIDLTVMFCCDFGLNKFVDPQFQQSIDWGIPLLDEYPYQFLSVDYDCEGPAPKNIDNMNVYSFLEQFKPDVVMLIGYVYRTMWRAARWAYERRIPVLLYSDSNAKARTPLWKRVAKQAIVRKFYRYISGALYIGDNNRHYHEHYGIPQDRLFPGVYPIDRERLMSAVTDVNNTRDLIRTRHNIPLDAFVLIQCARLVPRKRSLDFIVASHLSAKTCSRIWAILVGDGPERKMIEDYCQQEQVRNVVLTGFVNQAEVPNYFAASDVVVVTSDFDAHPLLVTEGAAFGLPVIVSDQIGCIGENDTARPNFNALVYPCGDRNKLSQMMEKLYDDIALYNRLSKGSLVIAEQQDIKVAAGAVRNAIYKLHELGPR